MKQSFNYTRESFRFLQAQEFQLFRADFYLTSKVVGQSTHFRKVCVRSVNLSESVQSSNNLTFKLSKQFIQRCKVNVGLKGCLVRVRLKDSIWEGDELNI